MQIQYNVTRIEGESTDQSGKIADVLRRMVQVTRHARGLAPT